MPKPKRNRELILFLTNRFFCDDWMFARTHLSVKMSFKPSSSFIFRALSIFRSWTVHLSQTHFDFLWHFSLAHWKLISKWMIHTNEQWMRSSEKKEHQRQILSHKLFHLSLKIESNVFVYVKVWPMDTTSSPLAIKTIRWFRFLA